MRRNASESMGLEERKVVGSAPKTIGMTVRVETEQPKKRTANRPHP